MLRITIPENEIYDESTNTFIQIKEQTLQLEHSLVSISKWESKWHKAFLSKSDKSQDEILDYIQCMTLTQNVDPIIYTCLTKDNIDRINNYIENPMTATTFFNEDKGSGTKEVVTSELIYYWMIALNIPVKFEKWHLNRLLTLIKVCNIKNSPPKKMGRQALLSRQKALNDARRQKLNSKG